MSNSPSLPSYSAATSSSKLANIQNKNKYSVDDFIIINEKVNLTKQQHEVLKTICDTYQMSFSEYMQQALIEAMMFDIGEGNFSDALLEKIGVENSKQDNSSPSSSASLTTDFTYSDLDLLRKLHAQI
jgi:hypothetical protein